MEVSQILVAYILWHFYHPAREHFIVIECVARFFIFNDIYDKEFKDQTNNNDGNFGDN